MKQWKVLLSQWILFRFLLCSFLCLQIYYYYYYYYSYIACDSTVDTTFNIEKTEWGYHDNNNEKVCIQLEEGHYIVHDNSYS